MTKEISDFTKGIVGFYTTFFSGVSQSLRILSKIQSKHKEEYKKIKEIQIDPTKIYELIDNLEDKEKRILLDLLLRANIIQTKASKIFDLSSKEQETFADEIETFSKSFTNALTDINVKPKK